MWKKVNKWIGGIYELIGVYESVALGSSLLSRFPPPFFAHRWCIAPSRDSEGSCAATAAAAASRLMRTPRTVVVTLRRLGDHLSPALRRSPPFPPFPSAADGSILAPLVSYASSLPHASSRDEDRSQEVAPARLDLLVFRSSSSARPPRIDSSAALTSFVRSWVSLSCQCEKTSPFPSILNTCFFACRLFP